MTQQRVYLSGGFRSNWQDEVISKLGTKFIFTNPRTHELDDSNQYWAWDMHYVKWCDIVFAYMDEDNPSGYGLALEVGLAYGLQKTIILIDNRSPVDPKFQSYFKIVHGCASVILRSLDEGIEYLRKFDISLDAEVH